jgi:cytoskeletal protein RodZ
MDTGTRLRHAREARGLTIDALARETRVQARILSAIEQNDSSSIPPRPYGRGFVRAYASEVGLDPEGTVREFFSQFGLTDAGTPLSPGAPARSADRKTATGSRRWAWPVGAVVGYAIVGAIVILAGRWAMNNRGEAGAVGTAGASAPTAAAAATIGQQPVAPPAAAPPPASGLTIALEATAPAWVAATVDGRREVYRLLQPGERVNLKASREIAIRAGDAGALTWRVNGGAPALMGRPGEVRSVRVTPEDAGRTR